MAVSGTIIHVIGIGLDGLAGLSPSLQQQVQAATYLVGAERQLSYVPVEHHAKRLQLGDLHASLQTLHRDWQADPAAQFVVLASGDPLFFGLGRLLLQQFPADCLIFHPHVSAVQLAFSRLKLPWQDAVIVSAHGRSFETLTTALQQGATKIAIFTDPQHSPLAIAQLLQSLGLLDRYQIWVCEDLGSERERVQVWNLETLAETNFAELNVVVLVRMEASVPQLVLPPSCWPVLGLPDNLFLSFADRPGLITKREVRVLALTELELIAGEALTTIWDIGAGTGSVAIEMARLLPLAQIYAVEKTALGVQLIQQNCQRLRVENVTAIAGAASQALTALPDPDRIFIGGSGGELLEILELCQHRLRSGGILVLALATLEHLGVALNWAHTCGWEVQVLQVQLARSVAIADLTRLAPLNPVTLVKMRVKVQSG